MLQMFRSHSNYGSTRSQDEGHHTQQSANHMAYEEIESYVECPTCQGAGRISKETEAEYVALIPLTDKRLRPRRTYLYVGITFAICVVVIILLVIFLTPRSIYLTSNRQYIEPSLTIVTVENGVTRIFMTLTNNVNLTNGNFFGITVSKVEMLVSLENRIEKSAVTKPNVWVGALGNAELRVTTNLTMDDKSLKITAYCVEDDYILRTLYMSFAFTVTATFNGQHMEATYSSIQGVDCYPTPNKTTQAPISMRRPNLPPT